jgi:hypothetical protein
MLVLEVSKALSPTIKPPTDHDAAVQHEVRRCRVVSRPTCDEAGEHTKCFRVARFLRHSLQSLSPSYLLLLRLVCRDDIANALPPNDIVVRNIGD